MMRVAGDWQVLPFKKVRCPGEEWRSPNLAITTRRIFTYNTKATRKLFLYPLKSRKHKI